VAVGPGADLSPDALAAALPGRPVRAYPALLSTDADAQAWARAGGPAGALVVADYQASPRGRGGLPWRVEPGRGLGFSLLVRPALPAGCDGWLYVVATVALADLGPADTSVAWPDEVHSAAGRWAAVGVHARTGAHAGDRGDWAVLSALIEAARPPRAALLAAAVTALEQRLVAPVETVLADYLRRCRTIGRPVRAHLVPLGPAGRTIEGTATAVRRNGGLVVETATGGRAVIPPADLGALEVRERT
jgi:BirA family transcriptional regulator, biotin operon repressor / biotin---[acetyl-CoA-carboxylase] ligase